MLDRSTSRGPPRSALVVLLALGAGCQASVAAPSGAPPRGPAPAQPVPPQPAAPVTPLPPGVSGTSTSAWKGFPIACGNGQTLILDHAQLPELEHPLVRATGDCHVTIRASRLGFKRVPGVDIGVIIWMSDRSELSMTDTVVDPAALSLGDSTKTSIHGGSITDGVLEAPTTVIGSLNCVDERVELDHVTLTGGVSLCHGTFVLRDVTMASKSARLDIFSTKSAELERVSVTGGLDTVLRVGRDGNVRAKDCSFTSVRGTKTVVVEEHGSLVLVGGKIVQSATATGYSALQVWRTGKAEVQGTTITGSIVAGKGATVVGVPAGDVKQE